MAQVFAQNVIEIAVNATVSGRPHVNVWHMLASEGTNVGDGDAAQDFANNWQDHIVPNLTSAYSLVDFAWRSLDPDDTNLGVIPPDAGKATVGASADAPVSVNTTLLIKKNTANRPRGRRDGRCFLSGFGESQIDGAGNILPATVTAWNGLLAQFFDGVTDNPTASDVNRKLCVLETTPASRLTAKTNGGVEPPPVTVTSRAVTSLTLDPVAATQRDRMR